MHISYFFFSSRRRHTRLQGDWSSDVCSSDLGLRKAFSSRLHAHEHSHNGERHVHLHMHKHGEAHSHEAAAPHSHTHAAFAVGTLHGVAGGGGIFCGFAAAACSLE